MIHTIKKFFPQSIKNVYHWVQAFLACLKYNFPSKKLKVIGVTGTDGKTTTANMIAHILEKAEKRFALASTINFRINNEEQVNTTKYTTLSSFEVQKFLKKAVDAGCEYVILEVSSHALDQNRLWGIHFDIAVLTNITREHLDYHKTMKQYRRAKRKLFENADVVVVNEAIENISEFLTVSSLEKITYGIKPKKRYGKEEYTQAKSIKSSLSGSSFFVEDEKFYLSLPGIFNIENALASIAVGNVLDIDPKISSEALADISGIPGRMESIANDRGIHIILDYAVTPEALEKIYTLISHSKSKTKSKIIAVFGACGDRDRGKRPIMGSIVDMYADVIILTNEDPYWEDPHQIFKEITQGITQKQREQNFFVIFDRRKAIDQALSLAKSGDYVVITGKGAEETMMMRGKMIPWSDKKIIEELLTLKK